MWGELKPPAALQPGERIRPTPAPRAVCRGLLLGSVMCGARGPSAVLCLSGTTGRSGPQAEVLPVRSKHARGASKTRRARRRRRHSASRGSWAHAGVASALAHNTAKAPQAAAVGIKPSGMPHVRPSVLPCRWGSAVGAAALGRDAAAPPAGGRLPRCPLARPLRRKSLYPPPRPRARVEACSHAGFAARIRCAGRHRGCISYFRQRPRFHFIRAPLQLRTLDYHSQHTRDTAGVTEQASPPLPAALTRPPAAACHIAL